MSGAAAQSNVSIIVDPADPMVYFGLILPAVPVFASAGFGLSAKGLIPFKPLQEPSQFQGRSLSDNVYALLELKIPTPAPFLSVNVNGTPVINVDANHDGAFFDFIKRNPATFALALTTNTLSTLIASHPALGQGED